MMDGVTGAGDIPEIGVLNEVYKSNVKLDDNSKDSIFKAIKASKIDTNNDGEISQDEYDALTEAQKDMFSATSAAAEDDIRSENIKKNRRTKKTELSDAEKLKDTYSTLNEKEELYVKNEEIIRKADELLDGKKIPENLSKDGNNKANVTFADKSTAELSFDAQDRETSVVYKDAKGNLIASKTTAYDGEGTPTVTYFDAKGNKLEDKEGSKTAKEQFEELNGELGLNGKKTNLDEEIKSIETEIETLNKKLKAVKKGNTSEIDTLFPERTKSALELREELEGAIALEQGLLTKKQEEQKNLADEIKAIEKGKKKAEKDNKTLEKDIRDIRNDKSMKDEQFPEDVDGKLTIDREDTKKKTSEAQYDFDVASVVRKAAKEGKTRTADVTVKIGDVTFKRKFDEEGHLRNEIETDAVGKTTTREIGTNGIISQKTVVEGGVTTVKTYHKESGQREKILETRKDKSTLETSYDIAGNESSVVCKTAGGKVLAQKETQYADDGTPTSVTYFDKDNKKLEDDPAGTPDAKTAQQKYEELIRPKSTTTPAKKK
ncbi:MAG: hypothetical protein LBK53_08235 [Heliobacteriaceae bacterium]|nr:hypothetical protein [Heliobacteriaceae bacterium]